MQRFAAPLADAAFLYVAFVAYLAAYFAQAAVPAVFPADTPNRSEQIGFIALIVFVRLHGAEPAELQRKGPGKKYDRRP